MKRSILTVVALMGGIVGAALPLSALAMTIDVSGSHGRNASNGRNGIGSGGDGTHAGRSTRGGHAGNIHIRLSSAGSGRVAISGTHHRTFHVGSSSKIYLKANGGRGGDGGHGGDGAKGSTGSRGRNATKHSAGTDGGRGGRGGDGGDGSPGSNAGNAGNVTVRVKEKDMHLLYLVAIPEVSGGRGGAAGSNGSAGPGGDGGSGGSSKSWREPYQSTCPKSESYPCTKTRTKSNGNGGTVTVTVSSTCTRTVQKSCTKYRSKSQPGGSRGSRGSSGSPGTGNVSAGSNGADGNYEFIVEYNNGRIGRYRTPFKLVVTDYQFKTDFEDRFAQPGEKLEISEITVTNSGGMPSPTMTPMRFRIDSDNGAAVLPVGYQDVVRSLQPGQSATFKNRVNGEVQRNVFGRVEASERWGGPETEVKMGTSLEIVGIHRFAPRFSKSNQLKVRYPVSLSRVLGKTSIAQGDEYLFRWGINNHSKKEVGSDLRDGQRVRISSQVFLVDAEKNTKDVYLKAKDTSLSSTSQGLQDVTTVKPQSGIHPTESKLQWAKIGFSDQAKLLQEAKLVLVAELEDPYISGKWHRVDVREARIKVGTPFKKTPGSDVLLVINPETSEEQVKAWREVFASLDRKLDLWDIGIMGPLDIGRHEIAQKFSGGTIVILNDLMKQAGDEAVPADAMFKLAPSDFTDLARENDISLYVFDRTGSYKSVSGSIKSLEKLDPDEPVLTSVKVNRSQFSDPSFITGSANRDTICEALSFKQKLKRYRKGYEPCYARAILSDLILEQMLARQQDKLESLLLFDAFIKSESSQLYAERDDEGVSGLETQMDLISKIWFFSDSLDRIWFSIDKSASDLTTDKLEEMVKKTFGYEIEHFKDWEKQISTLKQNARKLEREIRDNDDTRFWTVTRSINGDYYRQAVYSMFLKNIFEKTYTQDFEVFNQVLDKERHAIPSFH